MIVFTIFAVVFLAVVAWFHLLPPRKGPYPETNHLKGAFDQYYMEYQRWPKIPGIANPEQQRIPISGDIVRMLEGEDIPPGNNPRQLKFMEFQRKNRSGDPVSPYGNTKKTTQGPDDPALYYVKLDNNYDNRIAGTGDPADPPERSLKYKVIVWTYVTSRSGPPEVKGTWYQQ